MQSLWMLFASFAFSVMAMAVKLASSTYSISEIVMYRGLIGVLMLFTLSRIQGNTLATRLPLAHLWRGVVGVVSLWLWFVAISKLPLATAMTLNYMSPIWLATFLFLAAWWRGKSGFAWGLVAAILASSIGVVMLLRPTFHAELWLGSLMGLGSSVLAALAYLEVKRLGQLGEPEYRVVFYFSLSNVVAGMLGCWLEAPSLAQTFHQHSWKGLAFLLVVEVFATSAQMAMTRAYRLGNALISANLQYTGIVFSSIWGMLVWNDQFGWQAWCGMAIILGSGSIATYYNTRNNMRGTVTAEKTPSDRSPDPIATEL
ncbi:MAG: DMT family transporter [Burkholderiales bacterium]|nr:DMT family transporter [Burkholderiales bacterium]